MLCFFVCLFVLFWTSYVQFCKLFGWCFRRVWCWDVIVVWWLLAIVWLHLFLYTVEYYHCSEDVVNFFTFQCIFAYFVVSFNVLFFDQISVVIDLIDNACLTAFSLLLCFRLLFWFAAELLRVCIVYICVFFCVFVSFLSVLIRDEIFRYFGIFCCEADSVCVAAILLFCRRFLVCLSDGRTCRVFGTLLVRLFGFFDDFSTCACWGKLRIRHLYMLHRAHVFLVRELEHTLVIARAFSHVLILTHMLALCPCNWHLPMSPAQLYTPLLPWKFNI